MEHISDVILRQMWFDDLFFEQKKAWKDDFKNVEREIREWKKEENILEEAKKSKKRFYEAVIAELEIAIEKNRELYREISHDENNHWMLPMVVNVSHDMKKRIIRYKTAIEYQNSNRDDLITDDDIQKAKEYPIKQLLEIGRNGRAKCIFHSGEDFNLGIKNNFAHCFVCGESGDVIKVYRTIHGCGFVEAVRALS